MTHLDTCLKMIFDRWYGSLKQVDSLLAKLSDDALMREIAPGKNRGIYLLGHLIAVHDDMLRLLDMGGHHYPELQKPFVEEADKSRDEIPGAAELHSLWRNQCETMKAKFDALQPEHWFERHTAVSPEDFANEVHRNKLNIVITRTTHLQYHLGQLALLA